MAKKIFDWVLLRLKESLNVHEDQDVATLLGMSKAALSARKKRDSFPEDKLLALVARRPDLNIDVAYVLTGDRARVHSALSDLRAASEIAGRMGGRRDAQAARQSAVLESMSRNRQSLSDEEALLLDRYRSSPRELRDAALRVLLGGGTPTSKIKQKVSGTANQVVGINNGEVDGPKSQGGPGGKRKR